jgi:hypothetical protein
MSTKHRKRTTTTTPRKHIITHLLNHAAMIGMTRPKRVRGALRLTPMRVNPPSGQRLRFRMPGEGAEPAGILLISSRFLQHTDVPVVNAIKESESY